MNVRFSAKDFVERYDVSAYKGGKIRIDDKTKLRSLDELATLIKESADSGKLSPNEIKIAYDKLQRMKQIRSERKDNPIKTIFTTIIPIKKAGPNQEITQANSTLAQLERHGSGIETAVPPAARGHFESMIGAFDVHIDSHFKDLPLPPNQPIMIHVKEDNGLGDILYCVKTIRALHERFPGVEIQISVDTRTLPPQEVIKKIHQEVGSLPESNVFHFKGRPKQLRDPAIVIIMPEEPSRAAREEWKNFKKPPQQLLLKEYGFGDPLEGGGLSESSLGIFLEGTLTTLQSTRTQGEIINSLSNRQAKEIILGGRDPIQYQKENKLYFGYANTPCPTAGFIKSIVTLNHDSRENVDFFIRAENCIKGVQWQMEMTPEGLICKENSKGKWVEKDRIPYELLAKNGFSQIEIVKVKREVVQETIKVKKENGEEEEKLLPPRLQPFKNPDQTFQIESSGRLPIPGATGGKVLRILDVFPIPHGDVLKLNQGSEPEILVSGNQSFGEAVSAKKRFFYEVVPHARAFAAQMRYVGQRINPGLPGVIGVMQCENKPMDYEAAAHALRNPEVQRDFVRYGEAVQHSFNLSQRLEPKIRRLMWAYHSPPIAQRLANVNTAVQKLSGRRDVYREEIRRKALDRIHDPIEAEKQDFENLISETAGDVFWLQGEIASARKPS